MALAVAPLAPSPLLASYCACTGAVRIAATKAKQAAATSRCFRMIDPPLKSWKPARRPWLVSNQMAGRRAAGIGFEDAGKFISTISCSAGQPDFYRPPSAAPGHREEMLRGRRAAVQMVIAPPRLRVSIR